MSSFFKVSFLSVLSNGILLVLGFVSSVVIARSLGPQLQGIYNMAILLPTLLYTFLNLGQEAATTYYTAKRHEDYDLVIGNVIAILLIFTTLSLLIGTISIFVLKASLFQGMAYKTLFLALIYAPLLFAFGMLTSILKAKDLFLLNNKINIVSKIGFIVLSAVVLVVPSVNWLVFCNLLIYAAGIIYIVRYLQIRKIKPRFDFGYQKKSFSFGLKSFLSNLITYLNYRVDTVLIKLFLGIQSVGIYGLAVSLAEQVWIVSSTVSTILFPKISKLEDEEARKDITIKTFKLVTLVTLAEVVFLVLIGDFIIPRIYSEAYAGAVAPFKYLLIGIFTLSSGRVLANDLAGRGKPELNTYGNIVSLLINLVFNFLLIPRYGISGAAISTAISYTLNTLLFIVIYCKEVNIGAARLLLITPTDLRDFTGMLAKRRRVRK